MACVGSPFIPFLNAIRFHFVLFLHSMRLVQRMVIDKVKAAHPEVPVIIYINKSGALLERMATSGVDIVSLDWTVTVPEARKRIGTTREACKGTVAGRKSC